MNNKSVATALASPILRRKRTFAVTFLLVLSIALFLNHLREQKNQNPAIHLQRSQSFAEADLDRDAKIDEQNYLRSLSALNHQANQGRDQAPLRSNRALILLTAIVLGLLISLAVAYIVDYCDPCFHSPVQVARSLGVPLVVSIPMRTS